MPITETMYHGQTVRRATDAEALALDQHHDTNAESRLLALLMQARDRRVTGYTQSEKERAWDAMVDRLLSLDLSVTAYDFAVDLLHAAMFSPRAASWRAPKPPRPDASQRRRGQTMPWQEAGFANRHAVLAEARRLGYTGVDSRLVSDLWQIICDLSRDGSQDDLAA